MKDIKIEIGKRVDSIRRENNLSKEQLAVLINVSPQHLGKVIAGESGFSVEKIIEFSVKLGYSTDFILLGKKITFDENIKLKLNETQRILDKTNRELNKILTIK